MGDAELRQVPHGDDLYDSADERELRIRNAKLAVLYRGAFAIPTNFVVGAIVVWCLSDTFPLQILLIWYAANVAVAAARLYLHRRFSQAITRGTATSCHWDELYTLGSLASGALWAALCLLLPRYGDQGDYVLLIIVAAGMTAGALTTLSSYFPAYLAYVLSFLTPIALISLLSPDRDIITSGALMFLYLAMICIAGRKLNRSVARTIELQVDNEALNASLLRARYERDSARKAKWLMLGQLSHELRTPLNAILGFSEAMLAQIFGPLGNAHYEEYAGHVQSSGQYLLNLIDELLELSQGETGQLALHESELELAWLCALSVAELNVQAGAKNIALVNNLDGCAPALVGDETKLRRILHNLLDNAIAFSPPSSCVRIGGAARADGGYELTVHDNGIGMDAQQIAAAFKPFGRAASAEIHTSSGLGLGLPIARHFAALHGGTLDILSTPGQGTTCILALPPERLRPPVSASGSRAAASA